MGSKGKSSGILGSVVVLVLLILLIFLSNVDNEKLSYLENLGAKVTTPIQKVISDISNKLNGNSSYFSNIEELKKENEELKNKNSELETELRELEVLKAENQNLQEYMNLTEKYSDYEAIPAYVINKDVSNFSSNLVINVGSDDGIEVDMTVIADKGLVGHVISVEKKSSKVQVIIDPASTVSCNISTAEESIICKGTLENDQIIRATYIPTGAELIVGDSVQTSGIGGIYQKGIYIGTIKKIITTNNSIDRYAIVEPAVDFSKVNTVLVIKK